LLSNQSFLNGGLHEGSGLSFFLLDFLLHIFYLFFCLFWGLLFSLDLLELIDEAVNGGGD
jgi:hypothetical protein